MLSSDDGKGATILFSTPGSKFPRVFETDNQIRSHYLATY